MHILWPAVESPVSLVNKGEGAVLLFGLWNPSRIITKPAVKKNYIMSMCTYTCICTGMTIFHKVCFTCDSYTGMAQFWLDALVLIDQQGGGWRGFWKRSHKCTSERLQKWYIFPNWLVRIIGQLLTQLTCSVSTVGWNLANEMLSYVPCTLFSQRCTYTCTYASYKKLHWLVQASLGGRF